MISLRDYQTDSINAVIRAKNEENITRPLISLPTGTGKTIVFAELARRLGAKTLIIAHRDELLRQAKDKVKMIWPEASVGIIKAKENDYQGKNVVCTSVQSLSREKRLNQVSSEEFDLLVIDEAHHSCAKSYKDIIERLGFAEDDPGKLLLGVSATCFRADKKGLAHIFQKIVYQVSILTMIRAGYLSDVRGYRAYSDTDLSGVGTRNGDFIDSQLAAAINIEKRNQFIVDSYLEYAPGRKAIAFCADVQHAKDLADIFQQNGIESKALSGKSTEDERRESLQAFSRGDIQVLTNCGLFTEGFDEPSIDCVLMARPTNEKILYTQCIGRGTRKYPGKNDCIIIDFADNRHDVCNLPSTLGYDKDKLKNGESIIEEEEREERNERDKIEVSRSLGALKIKEFDLLSKSVFRWIQAGVEWRLPIGPGLYGVLKPDGLKYKTYLLRKGEQPELFYPTSLEIGYAQGIVEDHARKISGSFSRKDAPWRNVPATDKQSDLLRKLGLDPGGMTKGRAADAIEEFFASQEARRSSRAAYR